MLAYLRKATRRAADRGATAVEYGLMVAAIAAVIVGLVFGIGLLIKDAFQTTCDQFESSAGTTGNCPTAPAPAPGG